MAVATQPSADETALPNPLEGYLPEDEFCARFKVKRRTARNWRALGDGPVCTLIGRRIYYHIDDIRTWLRSRRVEAA